MKFFTAIALMLGLTVIPALGVGPAPGMVVTATAYSFREPEHHRYGRLNALGGRLDDIDGYDMKRADDEITLVGYVAIGWLAIILILSIGLLDDQHLASPPHIPGVDQQ